MNRTLTPVRTCAGCDAPIPADAHHKQKWCSNRCRKASYGDPCVDCGVRTCFGAEMAKVAEPRCASCAVEHRRRWTAEAITDALRAWVAEHGELPKRDEWLGAAQDHPTKQTVVDMFGSWNAGVVAAGLEPRPPHRPRKTHPFLVKHSQLEAR